MAGTEADQPGRDDSAKPGCNCVIAHVHNDGEQVRVQAALDNALKTNDAHAVFVACMQLMQPCPARDEPVTR
ncbi:hypothetical protein ACIBCO_28910 [Streptomyces violascens]|uniref:hypothetical protein n=1 Tax=Streptomyces violascens TaxID=67381 RepID=UPI0037AEEBB4